MLHFQRITLLFAICALTFSLNAQKKFHNPVDWDVSTEKINERDYKVILKLSIDKGWKMYAENQDVNGPISFSTTTAQLKNANVIMPMKSNKSPKVIEKDPVFMVKVTYFENEVIYSSTVRLEDPKQKAEITLGFEYMTCDDSKCLPPVNTEVTLELNK
jgi:thiol:disulfide interchange protein DsbD